MRRIRVDEDGGGAVDDRAYLIRYGTMGYVGRFRASGELADALDRGRSVVIRTDRGVELGEVLIPLDDLKTTPERPDGLHRVLRPAGPEDIERRRRAEAGRSERFDACRRVLDGEGWPWDIIDVEPLLEDGVTVIQYLGPHHLDVAAVRARFRMTYNLDVVLEPVGEDPEPVGGGCGSGGCGSGGCGSGGGCGTSSHGGCDSCALSHLAASRRAGAVAGTP